MREWRRTTEALFFRRDRAGRDVETAVRIVERWLLGRMHHRVFYSLADVNAAIVELLVDLNDTRVLRRVGLTRRQLFEEIDYPALRPLPVERYVFAEWKIRRAGLDYHVDIDKHYYSVPYRFAREQVEARIAGTAQEIAGDLDPKAWQRLAECGLQMHPEKTQIVYCRDGSRKERHPNMKFDFLGYTFRPRLVKNSKRNSLFVSFPRRSVRKLSNPCGRPRGG